mmetsp:Transcript_25931/g.71419  ORF Transcript_25931/g.71419 Transcript_25931/m.71419 type:complete len:333 (+) Transcript_25931:14-1012(+)
MRVLPALVTLMQLSQPHWARDSTRKRLASAFLSSSSSLRRSHAPLLSTNNIKDPPSSSPIIVNKARFFRFTGSQLHAVARQPGDSSSLTGADTSDEEDDVIDTPKERKTCTTLTTARTTNNNIAVQTRFILVEPRHRGNVGGVARAMKTMGFTDLVVVRPHDPKVLNRQLTQQSASGALDILRNARVDSKLEQALEGCDVKCATGMPITMVTGRELRGEDKEEDDDDDDDDNDNVEPAAHLKFMEPRPFFQDYIHSLTEACKHDATTSTTKETSSQRIAIVFGNEKRGMRQRDMNLCQVVLGIPTHPDFGSLNLAAAAQLIAYDWRQALGGF